MPLPSGKTAQAVGDGWKKVADLAVGDQDVVHVQQQTEAIAFAGQLFLVSQCALAVGHVVHGQADLLRYTLQKLQIGVAIGVLLAAGQAKRAQTPVQNRNRQQAAGMKTCGLQHL
jgi:hypothetical protein